MSPTNKGPIPSGAPGTPATTAPAPGSAPAPDPRRWWGLVVIAIAQLMVVLDATIVNIALPSAQRDLHMSDGNRQWVITAYTLAFGGLLLLGGRIADLVGRKLTFMTGLVGFAAASALGGAAHTSGMLFVARALQGAFGALLAPSALSLLTTTFTDGKERAKAFGIYGAIAGGGAAIGLIAGGLLTEYLDWRWCLYVNVPIALIALLGALVFLHDDRRRHGQRPRLDIPGVVLGCGGLVAIVYGCSEAQPRGWDDPLVLGLLCGGAALLAAFTWWQGRAPHPLLPLHIIRDRNRAGAFLVMGLAVIAMFGMFLFMTYYLQVVLGYSPVKTGLAFLPMTAAIIVGSTQISARLMTRVPPRTLMVPGTLLAAGGLFLLTFLPVEPAFVSHVLPAELLVGLGMGLIFMPVMATATAGVAPQDAGVTSATVNTAQQVGGSIGTALLNTIATSASTAYITTHLKTAAAGGALTPAVRAGVVKTGIVHGFQIAIAWGAGIMLLAGVTGWFMVTARAPKHAAPPGGAPTDAVTTGAAPAETRAAAEAEERHHMRAPEPGDGPW
ncbi:MFS transporter [Streptomyces telluris]|uniref:DHA2 family efflux MFS transporter permease subunit n=1 Tax=Streptomyces telluris TaxID=2720021 RepID=A0A9X2RMH7_9ACTN|nr:DHA2 family efflux MFS transporter permease subunit [Streptomyces telluris]NJP81199.1 DHA2 family efflux MFS transporter permease subunit [Streptomyces telluris]